MIKSTEIFKINFKKTKGESTNYLTHNFHPYPAKFIPQIPRTSIKSFTKPNDNILDPFCGCGTTLVESKLLNRNCTGIDLNPIAVLVSKSKSTKLNIDIIKKTSKILAKIKNDINNYYYSKEQELIYEIPNFYNRDHWFQENVLNELAIIKYYIETQSDENIKNYLYTAFSSIIVTVSNQESNTRFAAINKNIETFKTFLEFQKKLKDMNRRMLEFSDMASDSNIEVYQADTRYLDFMDSDSIDHIVTSPPYANTYDYYLYHKFRIYWIGHELEHVRDNEIGSRNKHSSKKQDISSYNDSLSECMTELGRVLKKDKYAVFVIGDCVIRGELFRANELMDEIASKNKFRLVKETSYNLKKNTRMFNPKFTNGDKLEHILIFKNEK